MSHALAIFQSRITLCGEIFEYFSRFVDGTQLAVSRVRTYLGCSIQVDMQRIPQDAPHHGGGNGEEMRAVLPTDRIEPIPAWTPCTASRVLMSYDFMLGYRFTSSRVIMERQ